MNLSNTVIALVRTWTPIVVGTLLTWLATYLHVVVDPTSQAGLVALAVAVLSAAYYTGVKFLEKKLPWTGWLLGVPATASYTPNNAPVDDPSKGEFTDADFDYGDTTPEATVVLPDDSATQVTPAS